MAISQPLSLFISAHLSELVDEQRALLNTLKVYPIYGWLWEGDTEARPQTVRSTYLTEVEACDIYIGLFWLGYAPHTIETYEHARKLNKPCLLYEKDVDIEQRSPELTDFLKHVSAQQPICRFKRLTELAEQAQKDVVRLLSTQFRESRRQSLPLPTFSSTTAGGRNKGIAIHRTLQPPSNGSFVRLPSS